MLRDNPGQSVMTAVLAESTCFVLAVIDKSRGTQLSEFRPTATVATSRFGPHQSRHSFRS
jgi:hypothetical protein